jgi:hypothetical protein
MTSCHNISPCLFNPIRCTVFSLFHLQQEPVQRHILDGHAVLFPYAFCNNKNAPVIGLSLFRCVLFPALSKEPQRHCCQAKIVAIIA